MRKIFIADAHLINPDDDNYRKILKFLATLRGTTDTLYILGDLFEYWIGYRTVPSPAYTPVVRELQALRDSGVSIVYLEGNHDFHLEPFFKTLGIEVHRGPAEVIIDGKRVYLCHGDQINNKEIGYRLLRSVLHGCIIKMLTGAAPISLTAAIARKMSHSSKKNHGSNRVRWDFRGILKAFAANRFQTGYDIVISGHFHTPFMEITDNGSERVLISLGDWISQFSYAEWKDGKVTLKEYL